MPAHAVSHAVDDSDASVSVERMDLAMSLTRLPLLLALGVVVGCVAPRQHRLVVDDLTCWIDSCSVVVVDEPSPTTIRFCTASGTTPPTCFDGGRFTNWQLCYWAIEGHESWSNGWQHWTMRCVEQ